ncbi:hypothetical protein BCR34DRAFT_557082 [Clohesyomyces aquaticus]|uniref:Uncharacterized protein n=1 Tax=Clohesyomyces aquaticus TaxID=1231657 RepID=A0A1Y2A3S2_9PLEO|nr:hypothetical protein BCR34DRAFT_557082 [Clohesyomyces aquaticus]
MEIVCIVYIVYLLLLLGSAGLHFISKPLLCQGKPVRHRFVKVVHEVVRVIDHHLTRHINLDESTFLLQCAAHGMHYFQDALIMAVNTARVTVRNPNVQLQALLAFNTEQGFESLSKGVEKKFGNCSDFFIDGLFVLGPFNVFSQRHIESSFRR